MNELIDILSQEENLLLQINNILKEHEQAVISKNISQLSSTISNLEEMLHIFENIDEKRKDIFQNLKTTMNLPQDLSFYNFAKTTGGLLLEKLFKVTEQLNNMAFEIERLKQLSDFQLRYMDVLIKLLNPQESPTYNEKASLRKDASHRFEVES
ncbi:flagellar export chaperone FlgN [Thermotoga profunda]|uniref:flagellar export chaperone FlgN n=1 Tax=Thermotoga profunda TaxID=1508420 RepID=UPI0005978ADB|nr:flagellar export chaperone FlgN [Thermotoga profunda]